jgi:hypothetical protein
MKKTEPAPKAPSNSQAIPQRKQLAMGKSPNTGAGGPPSAKP